MRVARTVLRNLDTQQRLIRQGVHTVAVLALWEDYQSAAANRPGSIQLTELSTGQDLLEALEKLPTTELLPILQRYLQTVEELFNKDAPPTPLAVLSPHQANVAVSNPVPARLSHPQTKSDFAALDAVEDRKLRRWMIKAGFIGVISLTGMIGGAAVVIGVRSGVMPDGVVVNSIMSTATEMLKLIFAM